jgi:hypothetical protein
MMEHSENSDIAFDGSLEEPVADVSTADLDRTLAQMKTNLDRLIHEADEAISESEAASVAANELLNA